MLAAAGLARLNRLFSARLNSVGFMAGVGDLNRNVGSTTGFIVIGDEILNGSVKEENCQIACQQLYRLGSPVHKISVIPDDVELISAEIRAFSERFDFVITSGGIGPTHDDKTFEAVAKAFDVETAFNDQLVNLISRYFKIEHDFSRAEFKMAKIPVGAVLNYDQTGKGRYPVVSMKNVFVLPGIPSLFRRGFDYIKLQLASPNVQYNMKSLYCSESEFSISSILRQVQDRFAGVVSIGSYPSTASNYYRVRLSLESTNKQTLDEATSQLHRELTNFKADCVLDDYDSAQLNGSWEKIIRLSESDDESAEFRQNLKLAVSVVEQCFDLYPLEQVAISFNGGKDCTALLHMCFAILQHRGLLAENDTLMAVHFSNKSAFPEAANFIELCLNRYPLHMIEFSGEIKTSLDELKKQKPDLKAIFMGSRITDPHGASLSHFKPTDPGWAEFIRVNPLLTWSYHDVWTFLRRLHLPYCSLYDQGYTSLGDPANTRPNPALLEGSGSKTSYKPAYFLANAEEERLARTRSKSSSS